MNHPVQPWNSFNAGSVLRTALRSAAGVTRHGTYFNGTPLGKTEDGLGWLGMAGGGWGWLLTGGRRGSWG